MASDPRRGSRRAPTILGITMADPSSGTVTEETCAGPVLEEAPGASKSVWDTDQESDEGSWLEGDITSVANHGDSTNELECASGSRRESLAWQYIAEPVTLDPQKADPAGDYTFGLMKRLQLLGSDQHYFQRLCQKSGSVTGGMACFSLAEGYAFTLLLTLPYHYPGVLRHGYANMANDVAMLTVADWTARNLKYRSTSPTRWELKHANVHYGTVDIRKETQDNSSVARSVTLTSVIQEVNPLEPEPDRLQTVEESTVWPIDVFEENKYRTRAAALIAAGGVETLETSRLIRYDHWDPPKSQGRSVQDCNLT